MEVKEEKKFAEWEKGSGTGERASESERESFVMRDWRPTELKLW